MLGLKLNHVSKRGYCKFRFIVFIVNRRYITWCFFPEVPEVSIYSSALILVDTYFVKNICITYNLVLTLSNWMYFKCWHSIDMQFCICVDDIVIIMEQATVYELKYYCTKFYLISDWAVGHVSRQSFVVLLIWPSTFLFKLMNSFKDWVSFN